MLLGCFILFPISAWAKDNDPAGDPQRTHSLNATNNVPRSYLPQGDTLKTKLLLTIGITLSMSAFAQTNPQTTAAVEPMSSTLTFRVNVVSRNVQAVNYEHRSGSSKLDFVGTDLMPSANGEAKVNSRRGSIEIDAEFGDLREPTTFGNENLTHVSGAISPA